MSAKKNCVACGKQIPSVALVCVFCSAKQPAPSMDDADDLVSMTATEPTMVGFRISDLSGANGVNGTSSRAAAAAEEAGAKAQDAAAPDASHAAPSDAATVNAEAAASAAANATADAAATAGAATEIGAAAEAAASEPAAAAEDPLDIVVTRPRRLAEPEPWASVGRLVMGIGGFVLMALFFCPWHGVSSWQLLETLAGAEFVRQLFYLTGGVVLVASAVLPLPFTFRALVGAVVASVPVLVGAAGVLDGWRALFAAIAILGLPATHLVRSREEAPPLSRNLVLFAVAAVALLYVMPESHVVPLFAVFKLMFSGSVGLFVLGLFVLAPLVFATLSLLGVMGRDLAGVGVLLSVLILLWAPLVVALRGLLLDDSTQLYVALALLWASATAALSWAQLLSLASAPTRTVGR
jgi:hypothetical protein